MNIEGKTYYVDRGVRMDVKITLVTIHLFGLAVGAGGAFMTDWLMLAMLRDGKMTKSEFDLLHRAGRFVIGGLAVLLLSGIGLFLTDTFRYMASDKFIAKMIIVIVLTINGIILHKVIMPFMKRKLSRSIWKDTEVMRFLPGFIAVGTVSFCSWVFALTLGSLSSVPFEFETILLLYTLVIVCFWSLGLLMARRWFTLR